MTAFGKAWQHYRPTARRLLELEPKLYRRLDGDQRHKMEFALTFACLAHWMEGWDSGLEDLRVAVESHEQAKALIKRAHARVRRYAYSSGLLDVVVKLWPGPASVSLPKRGRGRPRKGWLKPYEPALRDLGATLEEARSLLREVARAVAQDPKKPAQPVAR